MQDRAGEKSDIVGRKTMDMARHLYRWDRVDIMCLKKGKMRNKFQSLKCGKSCKKSQKRGVKTGYFLIIKLNCCVACLCIEPKESQTQ